MKISEFVKNKHKNRSRLDYSKQIGISNSQLARIENGYWDNPSPTQINNLCKIFNLTFDDLSDFDISEQSLYKASMYLDFEQHDIIQKCITNFYNNGTIDGKSFKTLYNPPKFEDIKGIDLKLLMEDISAICTSKTKKSDYIPLYFVEYKRIYEKEYLHDYDHLIRKYYSSFACTLSRMLLNGKVKKAIIITNSKSSYSLLYNWFNDIPALTTNKNIILAYCSIKNKGCEYYSESL